MSLFAGLIVSWLGGIYMYSGTLPNAGGMPLNFLPVTFWAYAGYFRKLTAWEAVSTDLVVSKSRGNAAQIYIVTF